MKIDVATLFPEAFDGLKVGIIAKALQKELFSLSLHNIRDYSRTNIADATNILSEEGRGC